MLEKTLSHYTVLEEIARTDLQLVYRARDEKLNREVALKVLQPDLVGEDDRRARFVQEAKASAALEHPHIGVIYEIDEVDGVLFIAMELLRGESLADRMEHETLSLGQALDLAIGIGQGLSYAHEHGIVHRDIKPANVMLTREGHPKLIDFGLAKLLDKEKNPFLSDARTEEPPHQATTGESVIAGTVSYMSPEQARGGTVDPRSDIFSFGVLLYQMLSGRPPFEGLSRIDTLYAILRDETPKLAGVGLEERQVLQPIIDRCLEKEPDKRYSSMAELLEELKRARLRVASGGASFKLERVAAAVGVGAAVVAALAIFLSRDPGPPPPSDAKPSLAVLHFENLTGDPDLEWLRTGLTDMLVTDLSQSPELEVLGTDRLYQILDDMDRLHGGPLTAEAVEELSRRAQVNTVLRGSFAKAGDSIRVSARLEDADTGKVILSEKAEGEGEDSLFRLVDEISGRIKANYSIVALEGELDRDLRDVTTASVEAYREYAEGIRLHERFREEEALPHFQRAVELDPGFAMALAKLGVVHSNLGMHEEADEYAEAALEHVDRLSERERHYIEGWYYSRKPETLDRAIAAYRKAVELYPDHGSARHNLGNLLVELEAYDEAIEQLEELRERGMTFPATYENLAKAYEARGDLSRAHAVLEEYRNRHPDDWTTVLSMAELLILGGDIDEGLDELERAAELGAGSTRIAAVKWGAEILEEEWEDAMETALELIDSGNPIEKAFGGRLFAITALYRGDLESVRSLMDRFLSSDDVRFREQLMLFQSRVFLETGENEAARDAALAIENDDHFGASHQALLIAAVASARDGDLERAEALADAFRDSVPANDARFDRLFQLLRGELALSRDDHAEAIAYLNEAESMLPPRGGEGIHTVIWYSLATAHRQAGNLGEALHWYERIVSSTEARLFEPIPYVRSFYFLGQLLEQNALEDDAHDAYERFLDHWEDGQMDRERVREVERRLN